MFDVAVDGHAKERILVVEINIKPKSEPYIQVICLCLNLSDPCDFRFEFSRILDL